VKTDRPLRVALVDAETLEFVALVPGVTIPDTMVEATARAIAENMPAIRAVMDAKKAALSIGEAFKRANRNR
jgi:hypothetical protein